MKDYEPKGETEKEAEYNNWFDEQTEVHGKGWHLSPANRGRERTPKVPFESLPIPTGERKLVKITWPRWGIVEVDGVKRRRWIVPFKWRDEPIPREVSQKRVHYEEEEI